ncbi:ethanolaminephosphotransferase [Anaeramoeba flamelloides]|uniref:Ethanolaminephosphotransferase n=1 Tax=Anaeramoeba flamelloides TaxID=1746091 RepID=A0AAV8A3C9_9EUKA|nr:ethanolaminephosphotransferase [Anaeramoeba flamelloides]
MGFGFVVISFIITWAYSPTFTEFVPRWVSYLSAGTTFLWLILDNCDGKQARKTKNESPVGQLLDHGCDCLSATLCFCTFYSVIGMGGGHDLFLSYVFGMVSFYFALWEEMMTDFFHLGIINVPDEGLIFTTICFLITGFNPDFWKYKILKISLITIFNVTVFASSILTFIQGLLAGIKGDNFKKNSRNNNIKSILPCLLPITIIFIWYISDLDLPNRQLRMIISVIGVIFANINFRVTLAHVSSNHEMWFYAKRMWALFIPLPLYVLFGKDYLSEYLFLLIWFIYGLLSFLHLGLSVTFQLSSYLGIPILTNKNTNNTKMMKKLSK